MRRIMIISAALVVIAAIIGFAMRGTIIDALGRFMLSFTEREVALGFISNLDPEGRVLPVELPRDRRAWGIYLLDKEGIDLGYKDIDINVLFKNTSEGPLRIGVRNIDANEVSHIELKEGETVLVFEGSLGVFIENMKRENRYRSDTVWRPLLTVRSIEGKKISAILQVETRDKVNFKENLFFTDICPEIQDGSVNRILGISG